MSSIMGELFDPKDISQEMRMYFEEVEVTCGAAWKRVVERVKHPTRDVEAQRELAASQTGRKDGKTPGPGGMVDSVTTTGWQPTCPCNAGDPVPQTVLDPFGGAATTALVADRLQRHAILCELNPDYAEMSHERLVADGGMFVDVRLE